MERMPVAAWIHVRTEFIKRMKTTISAQRTCLVSIPSDDDDQTTRHYPASQAMRLALSA